MPDNFINDANEALRLFNKQDFSNTKKFLRKVILIDINAIIDFLWEKIAVI